MSLKKTTTPGAKWRLGALLPLGAALNGMAVAAEPAVETRAGSASEFLTRSMRRAIDEETARLEWGLTALASIASTAPFVGLFGTVWGVYHALLGIGQGGAATLDQIAGPVGEALIMTGLGLAVAIPAVLAYNACARANRLVLARLDAYAHDLFAFLTTGAPIAVQPAASPTATVALGGA